MPMRLALLGLFLSVAAAYAQSSPNFQQGATLCANTGCSSTPPINPLGLNQAFMNKLDVTAFSSNVLPVSPTGNETNLIGPGNPATTYVAMSAQTITSQPNNREFTINCGITSNTGAAAAAAGMGNGDKVCGYFGTKALPGTGNVWSVNTLLTLEAGLGSAIDAQGVEVDFNNFNVDAGAGLGVAGIAAPFYFGLAVAGIGMGMTAGITVETGNNVPVWHRGFLAGPSCCTDASFQDLSGASVSVDIRGNHNYGVDTTGASTGVALRMGNDQFITGKNAAGSADLRLFAVDNTNTLLLGEDARGILTSVPFPPNSALGPGPTNQHWVNIGNYPIAGQTFGPVMQGIVSSIVQPATWSNGGVVGSGAQAIAGYCDNQWIGAGSACVGVYGVGLADSTGTGAGVNSGAWGGNFAVYNTDPLHYVNGFGTNAGKDFAIAVGIEVNGGFIKTAGGATPNGAYDAIRIVTAQEAALTNGSIGVHILLNPPAPIPMTWGFKTEVGAVQIAMDVGPLSTGNSQPSPPIYMRSTSPGGASQLAQIQATAFNQIELNGAGAIIVGMPTSAGTGGLTVCIDSTGILYKKATCP